MIKTKSLKRKNERTPRLSQDYEQVDDEKEWPAKGEIVSWKVVRLCLVLGWVSDFPSDRPTDVIVTHPSRRLMRP